MSFFYHGPQFSGLGYADDADPPCEEESEEVTIDLTIPPPAPEPPTKPLPSNTECYFHGIPYMAVVRLASGHPICSRCYHQGVPGGKDDGRD